MWEYYFLRQFIAVPFHITSITVDRSNTTMHLFSINSRTCFGLTGHHQFAKIGTSSTEFLNASWDFGSHYISIRRYFQKENGMKLQRESYLLSWPEQCSCYRNLTAQEAFVHRDLYSVFPLYFLLRQSRVIWLFVYQHFFNLEYRSLISESRTGALRNASVAVVMKFLAFGWLMIIYVFESVTNSFSCSMAAGRVVVTDIKHQIPSCP
jgi:hypothetical protein